MIALQIVRTPIEDWFTDIDRKTGQFVRKQWYRVEWKPIEEGRHVKDMAEAKALYGGSPVLEGWK